MKCPKCAGTLHKLTIKKTAEYGGDLLDDAETTDQIEVDQCLSCTGIWFDVNELDRYLAEKLIVLDSQKSKHYPTINKQEANCPKCNQPMQKRRASKTAAATADVCVQCHGVWLDGGEIDRLEIRNFSIGQKLVLQFNYLKSLFQDR